MERSASPYTGGWAEIGWLLGASRLECAATRLQPGAALAPMHWHTAEEEVCIVFDGAATLRTLQRDVELRRGDIIIPGDEPTRCYAV